MAPINPTGLPAIPPKIINLSASDTLPPVVIPQPQRDKVTISPEARSEPVVVPVTPPQKIDFSNDVEVVQLLLEQLFGKDGSQLPGLYYSGGAIGDANQWLECLYNDPEKKITELVGKVEPD